MARIFIVNHPHREPGYGHAKVGSTLTVSFNVSKNHRRKFIRRSGQYLLNNQVIKDELYFWGEYEPESECIYMGKTKPKVIHYNLYPVRGSKPLPLNALNTDPYVSGNHFKYICCGMKKYVYDQDDVVLFGKIEKDSSGIFTLLLDTVFVVKEKVQINFTLNTTQYYKASIESLKGKKQIFYRGKNYNEDKQYYSFVPCRLDYSNDDLPKLDLNNLGFNVKEAGFRPVAKPISFNKTIWNKILEAVEKAGWMRGIHIDKI